MIAAITCHFNPCNFQKTIENYWRFKEELNATLFTIELSFNGKFDIKDAYQVAGNKGQIMWQKECLLNLLIKHLPKRYDKIAWVDADLIFENRHWAAEAEVALDTYNAVQLFGDLYHQQDGSYYPSVIKSGKTAIRCVYPGGGWALHRNVKLLDSHILGGGDTMAFYAARGLFKNWSLLGMSPAHRKYYLMEAAKYYMQIKDKVTWIDGDVIHLKHGSIKRRRYTDRLQILKDHNFDPRTDIRIASNGIWEFCSDKPEMHRLIKDYFESRKEDE